ncbi:MAG: fibronectin type III domain-containing protein, partial [Caldilineaceae bacterium]|nr:fibronectin type III domain-containing protein [Caldilineaceae bacterium]
MLSTFWPTGLLAQEAQPGRINLRAAAVAAPQTLTINEGFDATTTPTGWTIQDVSNGGAWTFANPGARPNQTGGQGNFAIIDSDNLGGGKQQNTELRTPPQDLTAATVVQLKFKTYLRVYDAGQAEKADVDVSTDGGATWTNVWRQTATFTGNVALDISAQVAGKTNVLVRFRYYDAAYEWYWQVDDVQLDASQVATAPTNLAATAQGVNSINLTWVDNSTDETGFDIERSTDGTTFAAVVRANANQTTFTNGGLACNTTYHYRVRALNAAGTTPYTNVATAKTGACAPLSAINEDFGNNQLPAGWSVVTAPPTTLEWTPVNGLYRMSHNGATPIAVNGELRTPVLNFTGQNGVSLAFSTRHWYSRVPGVEFTVDASNNGGATWTNLWQSIASEPTIKVITLDLSAVAGNQPNVQVRFRFVHPSYENNDLVEVDDVKIGLLPAPPAPTGLTARTARNNNVLLAWTGNGNNYLTEIERSPNGADGWAAIGQTATNGTSFYSDGSAQANTTYFYRVRAKNASGASAYSNVANAEVGNLNVRSFDINISLYNNPTIAERNKYEEIMRFFSDAIYEGSNGAHRLGKVTFYTNGAFADRADIVWHAGQGTASARPAIGRSGAHINLYDIASSVNLLTNDPVQNSTLLLHEWGHYAYNLSHSPGSGMLIPGIGFQQPGWLEFSTARDHQAGSEQDQNYGASHWDVLARPQDQDPRPGQVLGVDRPYYPELALVKPPATERFTAELPAGQAAARSALQFTWAANAPTRTRVRAQAASANALAPAEITVEEATIIRQVVVETASSNVAPNELLAIQAALIDIVEGSLVGDSIGIISYDGEAHVVQPLTVVNSDAQIDSIIANIEAMTVGNSQSAPGAALEAAFEGITADGVPTDTLRAIYLIGSGTHNTGVHPMSLLPDLQAATLPVYTIGYGADVAGVALLKTLAQQSAAAYRSADAGLNSLSEAVTEIEFASLPYSGLDLLSGADFIEKEAAVEVPFVVDSRIDQLDIELGYDGNQNALLALAIAPDGSEVRFDEGNLCEDYSTQNPGDPNQDFALGTSCYTTILNPLVGRWTLRFQQANNMYVDYFVTGFPKDAQQALPAYVSVVNADHVSNEIAYPKPMIVNASMGTGRLVAGATVNGTIAGDDGSFQSFSLHDDGVSPDALADDGNYAALVDAAVNGGYLISAVFDNDAGTAYFTNKAHTDADDSTQTMLGENVQRIAETVVYVVNAPARRSTDPNAPGPGAQAPQSITILQANNSPVAGRIDGADDSDLYEVTVPDDQTGDFIVRVDSLAFGMDPYIIARSAPGNDGASWEREAFLQTDPTSNAYLAMTLSVQPGEKVLIEVKHFDPTATR